MIFNRRLEARDLHLRCRIEIEDQTPDGGGGFTTEWMTLYRPYCRLDALGSPDEGATAGRSAEMVKAVLTVRNNSMAQAITNKHRVVVDGRTWQIRGRYPLAQLRGFLRFSVETGVSQ